MSPTEGAGGQQPQPASTHPAPRAQKAGAAVKVKPSFVPEAKSETGPRRQYWIGTTKDCPIQNVHVYGVCFPRFTGVASFDDKGEASAKLDPGAVVELTEEQVSQIRTSVAQKVVRPLAGSRGVIVVIDKKNGARPTDVPLAKFLYMMDLEAADYDVRSHDPETMLEG